MQKFYKIDKPEGQLDDVYVALDGSIVSREDGFHPDGFEYDGRWVYRNAIGDVVDFGRYRNDLFSTFSLRIIAD